MPRMTRNQYDAGLDRIMDRYERLPRTLTETDHRSLNRELAEFKRAAEIVETTARAPAARPATRSVRETAPPRAASRPAASKPAKPSKRDRRIATIVRETLTAAAGPKPAPGTTAPAKPTATAKAPAKALHEMDGDQLAAATVASVRGASPFWRPQESAPAAPITESAVSTERDLADLASLSNDGLNTVFDRLNQRRGLVSPFWAA